MTDMNKVRELVEVTKQIEAAQAKGKDLREQLLKEFADGESITDSGYVIEKKVVKTTIIDANELVKNGFDVSKVSVEITKIDPTIVKRIGEQEGKKYYAEKPTIFVSKEKVK